MKLYHESRDNPYPDELDQEFCSECMTLCIPGNPCLCCYIDILEAKDNQ